MHPQPQPYHIGQDLVSYIEAHGYSVGNLRPLQELTVDRKMPPLDAIIQLSAEDESDEALPLKYEDLKALVERSVTEISNQLKPLLFAFFFQTVVRLISHGKIQLANEFFQKHKVGHHSIHDSQVADLNLLINQYQKNPAAITGRIEFFKRQKYTASLTSLTYTSLIDFFSERGCSFFLKILSTNIEQTIVKYSPQADFPEFIGTRTSTQETVKQSSSKSVAPTDRWKPLDKSIQSMALTVLGQELPEEQTIASSYTLPRVSSERVFAAAIDRKFMASVDKKNLPSIAYFTFSEPFTCCDINSEGTLIAVAQENSYTKLISSDPMVDLDDLSPFSAVTVPIMGDRRTNLLVPRARYENNPSHYFTRTLIGPPAYCTKFSPDSRLLLSGMNDAVRIWTCETNGALCEIKTNAGVTWCADWSPFGCHFCVGCDDNTVAMYSIASSGPIRIFHGHQATPVDVCFHPNAQMIVTCSEHPSVQLWDIQSGTPIQFFPDSSKVPTVSQFSPDGQTLVVGDEEGRLSLWDLKASSKIGVNRRHQGAIRSISFSQEGTLMLSVSDNGEVYIWDTSTLFSSTAKTIEPLRRFAARSATTDLAKFSARNLIFALGTLNNPNYY